MAYLAGIPRVLSGLLPVEALAEGALWGTTVLLHSSLEVRRWVSKEGHPHKQQSHGLPVYPKRHPVGHEAIPAKSHQFM